MASGTYNQGSFRIADRTIDYINDVIEAVIVKSSYAFDPDHTNGTPAASEITGVTGYTGGFGGSGRKALAGKTITTDTATNRTNFNASNPSDYTIGAGDTIGGVVIQKKGSASDATAIPIFFLDVTDFATNGVPFTLDFATVVGYLQNG